METLAGLHQFTFEMETFSGIVRNRNGLQWNKQGPFAMYGITTLPCDDGYVCFGISTEANGNVCARCWVVKTC